MFDSILSTCMFIRYGLLVSANIWQQKIVHCPSPSIPIPLCALLVAPWRPVSIVLQKHCHHPMQNPPAKDDIGVLWVKLMNWECICISNLNQLETVNEKRSLLPVAFKRNLLFSNAMAYALCKSYSYSFLRLTQSTVTVNTALHFMLSKHFSYS